VTGRGFRDISFAAPDGLELYARDYGGTHGPAVLCLCGLTRNSRDFEPLADLIAGQCRMVVPDYRGRGRSAFATDPKSYRPDVELADALRLLDVLDIAQAGVIGTSRGGLIAMLMGSAYPQRLTGVVFNDIGPVIEREGLLRIRSYLGNDPGLRNWDDAVSALQETHSGFVLSAGEWLSFARRIFRDEHGIPRLDYDPRLAETFPSREAIDRAEGPDLWPLFESLKPLPVIVLRGENSDLLSAATVSEMARRHPGLRTVTVKDRGHPPFLNEPECVTAISDWIETLPSRLESPIEAANSPQLREP
jgi:pimeloyl-ACP methyl ester carboxylesterase